MNKLGLGLSAAVVVGATFLASLGIAYADPPDDPGKPPPGSRGQGHGPQNPGPGTQGGPGISSHGGPHTTAKGWVSSETLTGSPVAGTFTLTDPQGVVTSTVVSGDTVCKAPGKGNAGKPSNAQCDKIRDGYYVTVKGTANSSIDATRIQIVPGRTFHCVGEVVSKPGGDLEVACRSGGTTFNRTFDVTGDTVFKKTPYAALNIGDLVTVVGKRAIGDPLTAKAVVKHGS